MKNQIMLKINIDQCEMISEGLHRLYEDLNGGISREFWETHTSMPKREIEMADGIIKLQSILRKKANLRSKIGYDSHY